MPAVSSALEWQRRTCPTCSGTGEATTLVPSCKACGADWSVARFDAWLETYDRGSWLSWLIPGGRNRYRWDKLPCGHDLARRLRYTAPACATCRGVGTVSILRLSRHFRERIAPPLPRYGYQPVHVPAIVPMRTPILAVARDAGTPSLSTYDWQRRRWWPT